MGNHLSFATLPAFSGISTGISGIPGVFNGFSHGHSSLAPHHPYLKQGRNGPLIGTSLIRLHESLGSPVLLQWPHSSHRNLWIWKGLEPGFETENPLTILRFMDVNLTLKHSKQLKDYSDYRQRSTSTKSRTETWQCLDTRNRLKQHRNFWIFWIICRKPQELFKSLQKLFFLTSICHHFSCPSKNLQKVVFFSVVLFFRETLVMKKEIQDLLPLVSRNFAASSPFRASRLGFLWCLVRWHPKCKAR